MNNFRIYANWFLMYSAKEASLESKVYIAPTLVEDIIFEDVLDEVSVEMVEIYKKKLQRSNKISLSKCIERHNIFFANQFLFVMDFFWKIS